MNAERFPSCGPLMVLGLFAVLGGVAGCGAQIDSVDPVDPVAEAPEPTETQPDEAPMDETAPIPFTARQIHDAMPVGREIRWSLVLGGQERTQVWRVRGQTDAALTLESGPPDGPFTAATTPWTELRQHAAFPAANTEVEEGVAIESPLSDTPLSTTRYVVQRTAKTGEPEVHTFWFAPDHPGPPVKNRVERGGVVTFEMQQVARTRVDPATWPPLAADEAPSP